MGLARAAADVLRAGDSVQRAFVANAIMADIIPQPFPARSTIGVASLPKGAQFEVEAIIVI